MIPSSPASSFVSFSPYDRAMARRILNGPAPQEFDEIRECLARLGNAFVSLLGNEPSPDRLNELGEIARQIGDLCDRMADRCVVIDANTTVEQ